MQVREPDKTRYLVPINHRNTESPRQEPDRGHPIPTRSSHQLDSSARNRPPA